MKIVHTDMSKSFSMSENQVVKISKRSSFSYLDCISNLNNYRYNIKLETQISLLNILYLFQVI